jgi:hypothetical protein
VVDFVVGVFSVKWKKSLKFHKKSKVDVVAASLTIPTHLHPCPLLISSKKLSTLVYPAESLNHGRRKMSYPHR